MIGFPEKSFSVYANTGAGSRTLQGTVSLHCQPSDGGGVLARGMLSKYPLSEWFCFYLNGKFPTAIKEGYILVDGDSKEYNVDGVENWAGSFDYTAIAVTGRR